MANGGCGAASCIGCGRTWSIINVSYIREAPFGDGVVAGGLRADGRGTQVGRSVYPGKLLCFACKPPTLIERTKWRLTGWVPITEEDLRLVAATPTK